MFLSSKPWKIVFWKGSGLLPTQKCLKVDPIPELKYSHLNISGPIHFRNIMSLEFVFVLLFYRTKSRWWRHWPHQKGGQ
jgi:hypothetical protein